MNCVYCHQACWVIKKGFYYRPSDQKKVQRFYCRACNRRFSSQTNDLNFRFRKRYFNQNLFRTLCSGVSQRRSAILFGTTYRTIARRVVRFGHVCQKNLAIYRTQRERAHDIQFDELETFEHTKCKPITVPIAIENKTRKVLAIAVGSIAAKGPLAEISRKKYGKRLCQRSLKLNELMRDLKTVSTSDPIITTDKSHHYPKIIHDHFPQTIHKTSKGRRGAIVGLGELKKGGHDPLFSLNHTYAMFRDNLKTLARKTWCTTKRIDRLEHLLYIYAWFHNLKLDAQKLVLISL